MWRLKEKERTTENAYTDDTNRRSSNNSPGIATNAIRHNWKSVGVLYKSMKGIRRIGWCYRCRLHAISKFDKSATRKCHAFGLHMAGPPRIFLVKLHFRIRRLLLSSVWSASVILSAMSWLLWLFAPCPWSLNSFASKRNELKICVPCLVIGRICFLSQLFYFKNTICCNLCSFT